MTRRDRLTIEQVSETGLGIAAHVRFDQVPNGRGLLPQRVEHVQSDITQEVTEIFDCWEHPGRAQGTLRKAILIKWWLLRLYGPLPGRPVERGNTP